MRAIWKNTVLAESEETIEVEGNHYFPPSSLQWDYFHQSDRHSTCPWKGEASYFNIQVGTFENKDAAWTYPQTEEAAKEIEGFVAFWKGVQVVGS
ncbi:MULTISPECIES: DUF427 domain-containing protein [Rufibacter]|uniref:Uncharacterized protein (DUF427 family) n=1 Tax=Rufibacter quisquiliarum TaxID=1549639 RepID=A0A839G7U9_9BACT|nr:MULTISPECIES: DUF427 domain-containing protein [Rufibacter]MBA9075504.1 uncharacterized protein (DUF427 family) [Rufibacter quisquiliarum]